MLVEGVLAVTHFVRPASQIIDRLPMTLESLKASKLGKVVVRLVKDPPAPGKSCHHLRSMTRATTRLNAGQ